MYHIPLIKPYIPPAAKQKVCEVLDSGYLTEGPVTAELEALAARYLGCKYVFAVPNCTVGLETALRALGIGPGDEVIVPDYTYPATADAAAIVGAVPVIVDIDPETMLIDYDALEKAITPRTKCLMPVSEFGNPLDYGRLNAIKQKYGLKIVEDAACALGSEYRGAKTGTLADVSVFSMHPRKFITSGEGGLITTNDPQIAEFVMSYKHFGMKVEDGKLKLEFERIGTNYKLSNILASVALEQFRMVDTLLAERLKLAARYRQKLLPYPEFQLPAVTEGGVHSYQTFSILMDRRDEVMAKLRAMGIEVQFGAYAIHEQKAFQQSSVRLSGPLRNSSLTARRNLALPLFYGMTEEEQDIVVAELLKIFTELK
ncbi:MAG: DegT/DnrJ/EryC1/StrS aminotransferase family protein [Lentisphaeria bacterium]|nr:DegT/DnrJ/EryC1/StrS aminotransferase family protein [Lentisphaeria bacterium]